MRVGCKPAAFSQKAIVGPAIPPPEMRTVCVTVDARVMSPPKVTGCLRVRCGLARLFPLLAAISRTEFQEFCNTIAPNNGHSRAALACLKRVISCLGRCVTPLLLYFNQRISNDQKSWSASCKHGLIALQRAHQKCPASGCLREASRKSGSALQTARIVRQLSRQVPVECLTVSMSFRSLRESVSRQVAHQPHSNLFL